MDRNVKAFLDTIATSEGTYGVGDDGYNVLVGSTAAHPLLFSDYSVHPNVYNKRFDSTAAGRYQELFKNWQYYRVRLDLPDFGHDSQDAIAIEQLRESAALNFVVVDRFEDAIVRCSHIWASLPGAGYGQRENSMDNLRRIYEGFKAVGDS